MFKIGVTMYHGKIFTTLVRDQNLFFGEMKIREVLSAESLCLLGVEGEILKMWIIWKPAELMGKTQVPIFFFKFIFIEI